MQGSQKRQEGVDYSKGVRAIAEIPTPRSCEVQTKPSVLSRKYVHIVFRL